MDVSRLSSNYIGGMQPYKNYFRKGLQWVTEIKSRPMAPFPSREVGKEIIFHNNNQPNNNSDSHTSKLQDLETTTYILS